MTTFSRTAIVTGAARRIGAAVARRFAGDGLAVVVVDLDEVACQPVVDAIEESALGNRGQANYSAAEAGLLGFIETGMLVATAERLGVPFAEFSAAAAAQIPVACTGTPEDVAHTVSYFAGEGAGYVSGRVLYVAGGSHG